MITADHETKSLHDAIPDGFILEPQGNGTLVVHHKRTGMGCLNVFLVIWLSIWTIVSVLLLRQYLSGGSMTDGDPITLWHVMFSWGLLIIASIQVPHLLFCRTSFRMDCNNLVVKTNVLGIKRREVIHRTSIRRLVQVKDGGEGEDDFPSWGLQIEGAKETTIIFRQPYEKSRWLGKVLAEWAGVEFVGAPQE